ncbi:MAG: AraC family transcriptional regulator [Planctomycetes bacterium]|nr:AraC family transcriptional regulator [Planctomycetota bacterium]
MDYCSHANFQPEGHTSRLVYRSHSVSLFNFVCSGHDPGSPCEEVSHGYDISIPRYGIYSKWLDGVDYLVDPNQVTFWNRGEVYSINHPASGPDACTVIQLPEILVREMLREFHSPATESQARLFELPQVTMTHDLAILHRTLLRYLREQSSNAMLIEEISLELCSRAIAQAIAALGEDRQMQQNPQQSKKHRHLVRETMATLNQCFCEATSLNQVARLVGSSVFHLARVFKRQTGITVHQYLTALRLRASLDALESGADNLTDLALSLGFSSHSHFTDTFKAAYAIPPSQFRDLNGQPNGTY